MVCSDINLDIASGINISDRNICTAKIAQQIFSDAIPLKDDPGCRDGAFILIGINQCNIITLILQIILPLACQSLYVSRIIDFYRQILGISAVLIK